MSYEHYLGYPRSSLSHQPRSILSSDCSTSYQNYQSTLDSLNTPFYQQQQLLPGQQENMHPLGYSGWTGEQQAQQVAQPNTLNYNYQTQQQEVFSGQQEMVPIGNAPWAVEQQINPNEHLGTVLGEQRNNNQNQFPGQQGNMDPMGYSGMTGQQQNYSNQLGSCMSHGQQPNQENIPPTANSRWMQQIPIEEPVQGTPNKAPKRSRKQNMAPFGDLMYLAECEEMRRMFNIVGEENNPISSLQVDLMNTQEWSRYHEHTNEMMIVNIGKLLFPQIGFTFTGMEPCSEYILGIKLLRRCENPFDFDEKNGRGWVGANPLKDEDKANAESNQLFSRPKSGAELMERGFTFENLKVYNIGKDNRKGKNAQGMMTGEKLEAARKTDEKRLRTMLLVSLRHLYVPALTVFKVDAFGAMVEIQSMYFEETEFMTVTEYKNNVIRNLKGANNKYNHTSHKEKCQQKLRSAYKADPNFTPPPMFLSTNEELPTLSMDPLNNNNYSAPSTSSDCSTSLNFSTHESSVSNDSGISQPVPGTQEFCSDDFDYTALRLNDFDGDCL